MFFFFSSRRRHTRFDCDWSSDVCSSDLDRLVDERAAQVVGAGVEQELGELRPLLHPRRLDVPQRRAQHQARQRVRSEEHTSELQSQSNLVCRLLLEKKTGNAMAVYSEYD